MTVQILRCDNAGCDMERPIDQGGNWFKIACQVQTEAGPLTYLEKHACHGAEGELDNRCFLSIMLDIPTARLVDLKVSRC